MTDTPLDDFDPAALKERERQLTTLKTLADRFGDSLANAFAKNVAEGKRFDETLKTLRQTLLQFALRSALAPLQLSLSRGLGSLLQGLMGGQAPMGPDLSGVGPALGFAKGAAFSRGMVTPFAQGGVVAAPTYFPLGRGLGVMGEAGAEAIMPLARGPDGQLGVAAGVTARPVSVVVNIATPDAESFRRSETQVAAALARAVARGQRGL